MWRVITPGSQGNGTSCVRVGMLWGGECKLPARASLPGLQLFARCGVMLLFGGASEVGIKCGVGGGFWSSIARERVGGGRCLP